jgi:hypothetical protein
MIRVLSSYLPIREPEDVNEVRAMMTGKRASVESQMKFDYPYILATMSSSKDIQARTYWYNQLQQELRNIREEVDAITLKMPRMDPIEYDECKTRYFLEQQVGRCSNADKKRVNTELNKWNNTHMGSKWVNACKLYKECASLQKQIDILKENEKSLRNYV